MNDGAKYALHRSSRNSAMICRSVRSLGKLDPDWDKYLTFFFLAAIIRTPDEETSDSVHSSLRFSANKA